MGKVWKVELKQRSLLSDGQTQRCPEGAHWSQHPYVHLSSFLTALLPAEAPCPPLLTWTQACRPASPDPSRRVPFIALSGCLSTDFGNFPQASTFPPELVLHGWGE